MSLEDYLEGQAAATAQEVAEYDAQVEAEAEADAAQAAAEAHGERLWFFMSGGCERWEAEVAIAREDAEVAARQAVRDQDADLEAYLEANYTERELYGPY